VSDERTRAFRVLFETPVGALSDRPLFATPTDLAEKMVSWGIRPDTSPRSLASYLNQILSRGDRNFSDQLREDVCKAIVHLFSSPDLSCATISNADIEKWQGRLCRAIIADNASRALPLPLNVEQLTFELFSSAEDAKEQFIITSSPAEAVRTEHAVTLRNILLRRVGLLRLADTGVYEAKTETQYTFNFPTLEMATGWWDALFEEVDSRARNSLHDSLKPEKVHETLVHLNRSGVLVVQVIPPEMCALPVVAFDPLATNACAYVFFYHEGIRQNGTGSTLSYLSLAKLDRHAYAIWRETAYRVIRRGRVAVKTVPYKGEEI